MTGPRGGEKAARLRAARGYSGMKQPELAAKLDVSADTLGRMERGKGTITDDALLVVARECGVPLDFLRFGFKPLEDHLTDDQRLALEVEQRLMDRIARIESALADPTRDAVTDLRRLTALHVSDADAESTGQPESKSRDGADASSESAPSPPPGKRRSAGGGES